MAGRLTRGLFLTTAVGLALVTALVGVVGFRQVLGAVASIGWTGFAVFTLCWLPVLGVAGLAWACAARGAGLQRPGVFIWGRLVRDAAADVLPFSQVGGLLAGGRAVMSAGVAEHVVLASTMVDMIAEIAAQLLYTLLGIGLLALLLNGGATSAMIWSALGGVALLCAAVAAFLLGQRHAVRWLGRLARLWLPDALVRADAVTEALDEIYREPVRVAAAVLLHVAGWIGGGAVSWIALRFMGVDIPFWALVAVESLMYAIRNLGFALPGGLGVQEGAYALLGPLVGLPASDALALSLLKRARDLAIGVPVLLIWQADEGGRLMRRPSTPPPDA